MTEQRFAHRDEQVMNQRTPNVTSVLDDRYEHTVSDEHSTFDDKTLNALGYKQEFKRDFSIWESFSVSFSCLGLLPSVASSISYGLGYSGTGGAVWGWLIAGIIIQSTAFSIAELCSSIPTAGWSNFCGFVTGPCSINYALAAMLITAAEIAYPSYVAATWHIYLCLLALLVVQGFITMQSTWFIGWVNKIGTIWNLAVVVIFIIWFPVGSINHPKTNSNREVWTQFENGTEWPIAWSTIMGFLTVLYTMAGFDAPFHLSEECSNSNIASPRAIVMTSQLGLYLGWAIVIVIAYTVQDISQVVEAANGQPFGSLCLQVLGKDAGLAMFALNIVAQFFCGQGLLITATRVTFALSRDGAVPGSKWWSRVDRRTKTPVLATWGIVVADALLGLLMFGGPVTIYAVFSIGAIAQYTAFTIPIILKLIFAGDKFKPGPWHLGRWSKPLNVIAIGWWLLIMPALCFPYVKGADLTPMTMNWTCLIYGGVMALAMLWYAIDGRKWFRGPRVNLEHIEREEQDDDKSHSRALRNTGFEHNAAGLS